MTRCIANYHSLTSHGGLARTAPLAMYVFAMLVLSSPASAQLAVGGEQGLVDTCQVPEESSRTHSLLQSAKDAKVLATASHKEERGGAHQSIFALPVSKINSGNFWLVVAGMLLFTVAVDRGQAYLDHLAEESERRRALLDRMNSELVMFGVVAVSLFVITNLVSVEEVLFLQVEYVDILCSLTCILLLSVVAVYFAIFNNLSGEWQAFEEYVPKKNEEPDGIALDAVTYKVLALEFKTRHRLPEGFVFLIYLRECFVIDCCDVMNVRWYMWAILMVIAGVFYFMRGVTKSTMSDEGYLLYMAALDLCMFFAFYILATCISKPYVDLIKSAPDLAQEMEGTVSRSITRAKIEAAGDQKKNNLLHALLQSFSVVNAFLVMHYVMHEIHIIGEGQVSPLWYLSVLPLLLNFVVLLPVSLIRMSFVDAYYNSNHDALDAMLTALNRLDNDKRYIKMLWEQKGRPRPSIDGDLPFETFKDVLLNKQLNLYVNDQRARRLFLAFDLDQNGTVHVDEFMQVLSGTASSEKIAMGSRSSLALFRSDSVEQRS